VQGVHAAQGILLEAQNHLFDDLRCDVANLNVFEVIQNEILDMLVLIHVSFPSRTSRLRVEIISGRQMRLKTRCSASLQISTTLSLPGSSMYLLTKAEVSKNALMIPLPRGLSGSHDSERVP